MNPAERLEKIPRVHLADLPTPLQSLPRLAKTLGLSELYAKRDDLTGSETGGNKARKLEYEFARLLDLRADTVLTIGGEQSNHARIVAAFARKLGLEAKLVLAGGGPDSARGNLLLDQILGAEVRCLPGSATNSDLEAEMEKWADELRREGRRPYCIPLGGSTALGALGYVRAMQELSGQFKERSMQIVLAVGSCGTLAGVYLGASFFLPRARVVGISVSRPKESIIERTLTIASECAQLIGGDVPLKADQIDVHDGFYDEYGKMTDGARQAILLAGKQEGLLLDPIYTAKAMAGLCHLSENGGLDKKLPTIFLHTGGMPILFSFDSREILS